MSMDKGSFKYIETIRYIIFLFLFSLYVEASSYVKKGNANIQIGYEWILFIVFVYLFIKYKTFRHIIRVHSFAFVYIYMCSSETLLFSYDYSRVMYLLLTGLSILCLLKYYDSIWSIIEERKICFLVFTLFSTVGYWFIPVYNIRDQYGHGHLFALIVFLMMYLWTAMLFASLQLMIEKSIEYFAENRSRHNTRISWKTSAVLMLSIGLFWAIMYYPGIFTPDVATIYNCAINFKDVSSRSDIHSFLYILIEHAIFSFTSNYFILVIILIVNFSIVWALLCKFLNNNGVSSIAILLMTVIWVSFPANTWMMISSWKDQPFTTCMLLLEVLLSAYSYCHYSAKTKLYGIGLSLSMFGISAFRSNGQVVLILTLIFLTIIFLSRKKARIPFISAVIATCMLLLFKGSVFNILRVSETPKGFASLPFINAIWESSHNGRELTDKTIHTIEDILPIDEFNASYRTEKLNFGAFPDGYLNLDTDSIVKAFIETATKYPSDALVSRMKKTYNIWSVFPSSDYKIDDNYESEIRDFTEIGGEEWHYLDEFELARKGFSSLYISPNFLNSLWYCFGRSGFCIFVWWVLIHYCIRKREKRILLPILPALFNTCALMVGCCFQDCAYFYPMVAVSIPYFFIYINWFVHKSKKANVCIVNNND